MSERIECVCPACRTTYRVPAQAAGRRARCQKCGEKFRLEERLRPLATEEDILRWLCEADDQDEAAATGSETPAAESTESDPGRASNKHRAA